MNSLSSNRFSNTLVLGLVRFSLLTKNPTASWEMARQSQDSDYGKKLFSFERLQKRFALFEAITLPSLDQQEGDGFVVSIMTSELLPDVFKRRLEFLAESRHYLRIDYFSEINSVNECARKVMDQVSGAEGKGEKSNIVTFRIDDDDAIFKSYVRILKEIVLEIEFDSIISFENGIYIQSSKNSKVQVAPVSYSSIALGLAYLSNNEERRSVFDTGNHARSTSINRRVISDCNKSWIRSVYPDSDSRSRRDVFSAHTSPKERLYLSDNELANFLREDFPSIDAFNLRTALEK